MINQLINELDYNPRDPFDIKKDIFPSKLKTSIPHLYDEFLENFYREWLLFTFGGEFETTITYPEILNGIKTGRYDAYLSDLSTDDYVQLCDYFTGMIKEEKEHAEHFLNFIKTIYGDSVNTEISDHELELKRIMYQSRAEHTDFVELLLMYYLGECYLWTCFYQVYKQTVDSDKRRIFKKLLVEEAQHNNRIYKLMKKIKNKVTIDKSYLINHCHGLRYFGIDFVKKNFKLEDNNSRKDNFMLNLIYNNEWHRDFNTLLIKKWYQLFGILYPHISIEEFTAMVNQYDGQWSSQPLPKAA